MQQSGEIKLWKKNLLYLNRIIDFVNILYIFKYDNNYYYHYIRENLGELLFNLYSLILKNVFLLNKNNLYNILFIYKYNFI